MASEKDVQDVIRTLIAEGVGEGQEGMRRIAETILNRAEQRGISPAEVVRQRAQYTGYERPGSAAVQAFNDPKALTAAQAAWQMAQGPDDPTGGANHYFNPNIVTPSWARSMTPTGTYGGHAFYTDRPYTQQGALPRTAPTPASQTPLMASSRAVTSPSGGNAQLQSALNQMATREGNRVTPASVEDRVTARNRVPVLPIASSEAARRAALSMGSNQTYAGQDRGPSGSLFNGDPLTPSAGRVVASIPTARATPAQTSDAARRAALTMTQSYASQDRAPVSNIGRAPVTRSVQSVPVPRIDSVGAMPSFNALSGAFGTSANLPNQAQLTAATGFRVPQASQFTYSPQPQPQRLAANTFPVNPTTVQQVPVQPRTRTASALPQIAPPTVAQRTAPVPMARPTAVGTQLAVTPQRAAMPVAQARLPVVQQRPFPLMASAPPPLNILVQGSNTAQPAPVQPRIWLSDLVNGGRSGGSTSSVSYGGNKSAF